MGQKATFVGVSSATIKAKIISSETSVEFAQIVNVTENPDTDKFDRLSGTKSMMVQRGMVIKGTSDMVIKCSLVSESGEAEDNWLVSGSYTHTVVPKNENHDFREEWHYPGNQPNANLDEDLARELLNIDMRNRYGGGNGWARSICQNLPRNGGIQL